MNSGHDIVTNSAIKTYRGCPRLYKFKYVLGYRSTAPADALTLGTLVHGGLEAWFKARTNERRLPDALEAISANQNEEMRAKAFAMLMMYDCRWADEPLKVLAVEEEFEIELPNGIVLAGKIDALVENKVTGRRSIVEHKTSSEDISPGSNYWKRLKLDSQISTYDLGAEALNMKVDDCLYDVLYKPQLKRGRATPMAARKYRKADGALYENMRAEDETVHEYTRRMMFEIRTNLADYFARSHIPRPRAEKEEALNDLMHWVEIMLASRRFDRFPRNPDNCTKYGRPCEFKGVCDNEDHLDNALHFFKSPNLHPELSHGTDATETATND